MSELKCKECGAILEQGVKECPSCGCPITETKEEQSVVIKEKNNKKFNIISIFSIFLGIVIIIMGIVVMNKEADIDMYRANDYDADSAKFGADFYTEIYKASDIIVDELNDINSGVEVLSESMAEMANTIYYSAGMIIISVGIGVIAVSCKHIKKETL